ncbi:MAG TPA: hypothetical protein VL426_06655 [Candidatus Binatia bacterium]|jgi:hypothetical protein|nr:hypothetical protein [Candidatus Binatia bacterium]
MNRVHPAFRIAVRVIAGLGLAAALGFLFARAVVPDGRLSVTYDLERPAPYVSQPKPTERLALPPQRAADGTPRTRMIGDPLFVDVTPPSGFDTVTMSLSYENSGHPMVEVGALSSSIDEQYDLRPIESRLLDALPWKKVSSGALTLYQRRGGYASVDEFFRDPPARAKVAVFGTDAPIPYRLEGYEPSAEGREIGVSLRGHQRMLTYVKDEPLNFTFTVQDMNRQDGADPVIVSVYRGDGAEPVARTILRDDGDTTDDQRSSKLRTVPVSLVAPEEGFYKIEFTASADVFIRKIATRQRKLVFADKLYLGDHVGFSDLTPPITVFTDGQRLVARTAHAESVQQLTVAGTRLSLDQPNLRYVRDLAGAGLAPIVSSKRDVLLETDGLFALSKEEYFDPLPLALQWFTTAKDLDDRGIEYVLAAYEPPRVDGSLRTGTVAFDMRKLARTKEGAYRFVISAPGIAETRHDLSLASISFSMRRPAVTLANALPMLFDALARKEPAQPAVFSAGKTYGESPN